MSVQISIWMANFESIKTVLHRIWIHVSKHLLFVCYRISQGLLYPISMTRIWSLLNSGVHQEPQFSHWIVWWRSNISFANLIKFLAYIFYYIIFFFMKSNSLKMSVFVLLRLKLHFKFNTFKADESVWHFEKVVWKFKINVVRYSKSLARLNKISHIQWTVKQL